MDVQGRTYDIIQANPVISLKEIIQELNRDLAEELQDAIRELLSSGRITKRAGHYEVHTHD